MLSSYWSVLSGAEDTTAARRHAEAAEARVAELQAEAAPQPASEAPTVLVMAGSCARWWLLGTGVAGIRWGVILWNNAR
jgi:hypothetical protein